MIERQEDFECLTENRCSSCWSYESNQVPSVDDSEMSVLDQKCKHKSKNSLKKIIIYIYSAKVQTKISYEAN